LSVNIRFQLSFHVCCGILSAALATGCQSTGGSGSLFSASQKEQLRNPAKTHLAFAKLSEKTGDLAAARESYQTVLEHNPQSVAATMGLAGLELRAGRAAAAERQFLKARTLAPADPLVSEALGQFYLSEHRYGEAERCLSEGLQGAPGNQRLQYRLGVSLAHQGRIDEADALFVQALGKAEADYNIGLILYEQGNTAGAEKRLLQALIRKPELNQAQQWLQIVRAERAETEPSEIQSPVGGALPNGSVTQVSGSEYSQQAALGSLNLAARQALARQQSATREVTPQTEQPAVQDGVPENASTPAAQHYQTLDTSHMTPTQYEQLKNSLSVQQSGAPSGQRMQLPVQNR